MYDTHREQFLFDGKYYPLAPVTLGTLCSLRTFSTPITVIIDESAHQQPVRMPPVYRHYIALLEKYPLLTKCITSGLFMQFGDYITQTFIEKQPKFDPRRSFDFFVIGTFYFGPSLHIWYSKFLPHLAAKYLPHTTKIRKALGSMAFDQILFSPVLYGGFFVFMGVVEEWSLKKGLAKGIKSFKAKILQTLAADLTVWPSATFVNLYYVPIRLQFLYFNTIGLFWDVVLCYILKKK